MYIWDEFIEWLKIIATTIFAITCILGSIIGMFYVTSNSSCDTLHKLTGMETNMSLSLGCLVKYKGQWVDNAVVTSYKKEITIKFEEK